MDDREAMQQALACARRVEGRTSPRPPVGAVLVRDGHIVGSGATSPPYGPHAEIYALQEARSAAYGADLYTTLEPCCVTIHTPPCTQAIIRAGVRRVVIGALDPNPRVYRQGVEQLRAAGIEVVIGVEEHESLRLIQPFKTFLKEKRPYVTAKWAMTLDGKLATQSGDAYWISGPAARAWVHNLRDRVDAILIGAETARKDNPRLTVRLTDEQKTIFRQARQGPLRVVLATLGDLPAHLQLLQPDLASGTCVIVAEDIPQQDYLRLQETGALVLKAPKDLHGQIHLHEALLLLAQQGIMHVLLEGGASMLGSAFDQDLIDAVAVFVAPKLVGGAKAPSPIGGDGLTVMQHAQRLQNLQIQQIAEDLLIEGELLHTSTHTYTEEFRQTESREKHG